MLLLRWLNVTVGIKLAVLLAMLVLAILLAFQRLAQVGSSFIEQQSRDVKTLNQDSKAAQSHRW